MVYILKNKILNLINDKNGIDNITKVTKPY
jgi:hypothetical protein